MAVEIKDLLNLSVLQRSEINLTNQDVVERMFSVVQYCLKFSPHTSLQYPSHTVQAPAEHTAGFFNQFVQPPVISVRRVASPTDCSIKENTRYS